MWSAHSSFAEGSQCLDWLEKKALKAVNESTAIINMQIPPLRKHSHAVLYRNHFAFLRNGYTQKHSSSVNLQAAFHSPETKYP